MKMEQDVRWELQFSSYGKALERLSLAVDYVKENVLGKEDSTEVLDDIIMDGLIQRFQNAMELAWNTMKAYANYRGHNFGGGDEDAVREAIQLNLIPEGRVWMEMLMSRNKTSDTYHQERVHEIFPKILNDYYPAFLTFQRTMEEKRDGNRESDYQKWIS